MIIQQEWQLYGFNKTAQYLPIAGDERLKLNWPEFKLLDHDRYRCKTALSLWKQFLYLHGFQKVKPSQVFDRERILRAMQKTVYFYGRRLEKGNRSTELLKLDVVHCSLMKCP